MNAVTEVSYNTIVCPKCLKEQNTILNKKLEDEFIYICEDLKCNTIIRVVSEPVIRVHSSILR